jgi:hypothetical protein
VIAGLLVLLLWIGQDTLTQALEGGSQLAGTRATVFFMPPDSGKAVRVLEALETALPLPGLPAAVPTDVQVLLAPDEATFQRLTGGRAPDWGAGVALPDQSAIIMPAYVSDRGRGWSDNRVLRHEWAHIGLHQYLEGLRLPRWFSEGYAQWASGGWDWSEGWKLRVALVRDRNPLDSLDLSWPRDQGRAQTAYLLSATTIEYLVVQSSPRALEILLSRWKEEGNFERAFRSTYGVTTAQFEEDWRRYVKDRYGWLFVLSHSAVFWMFLSLALAAMVGIRRRARRERLARLRAQDAPDQPDFWTENPSRTDARGPDSDRSE